MHVYVESVKNPALRFEVLEYDPDTKIGKLQGGVGAVFTRKISKDELEKLGYHIVKSETPRPLATTSGAKSVGTIADDDDPVVEVGKKKPKK
jgi:hypothetical protein